MLLRHTIFLTAMLGCDPSPAPDADTAPCGVSSCMLAMWDVSFTEGDQQISPEETWAYVSGAWSHFEARSQTDNETLHVYVWSRGDMADHGQPGGSAAEWGVVVTRTDAATGARTTAESSATVEVTRPDPDLYMRAVAWQATFDDGSAMSGTFRFEPIR